jgi:hypothetical protein
MRCGVMSSLIPAKKLVTLKVKGKGTVDPITVHEGPEVE